MKAFEVYYQTPRKSDRLVLLVEDESKLEDALAAKDTDVAKYRKHEGYTKISSKREIPLSTVMVRDLSVTELLTVMNNK